MTGVNNTLYYIFVLRSYRYFARVPQGSRKVPAREAASNPNEHLVTEYLAPVIIYIYMYIYIYIYMIYIYVYTSLSLSIYIYIYYVSKSHIYIYIYI